MVPTFRSRLCGRLAASFSTIPSPGPSSPPPIAASVRDQVRRLDMEGYFCASLLPSAARESALVMRAFNLEVASVRDGARGNAQNGRMRMLFWRQFIEAAYSREGGGGFNPHPLFVPFSAAVSRHGHSRAWLDRLIDARDADLDAPPPQTTRDLERYGEATHGSLLLLALEASGVGATASVVDEAAETAAMSIARASIIATVLRSLPIHARLGQRYVPDDLLRRHELAHEDLLIRVPQEIVVAADGGVLKPLSVAVEEASKAATPPLPPASSLTRGTPTVKKGSEELHHHFTMEQLRVSKDPEVRRKICLLTQDLVQVARAHLQEARSLRGKMASASPAALLPAQALDSYFSLLEQRDKFDPLCRGLLPWRDERRFGRLFLQLRLLGSTITNTF